MVHSRNNILLNQSEQKEIIGGFRRYFFDSSLFDNLINLVYLIVCIDSWNDYFVR